MSHNADIDGKIVIEHSHLREALEALDAEFGTNMLVSVEYIDRASTDEKNILAYAYGICSLVVDIAHIEAGVFDSFYGKGWGQTRKSINVSIGDEFSCDPYTGECDRSWDDGGVRERVLIAVAPYVHDGDFISVDYDDGTRRRYLFRGRKLVRQVQVWRDESILTGRRNQE